MSSVNEAQKVAVVTENEQVQPTGLGLRFDSCDISFTITQETPFLWHLDVVVPAVQVTALYNEAARTQQAHTVAPGFSKGTVPVAYIQNHYKQDLVEHVKEVLLKYRVVNFVYRVVRNEKIPIAQEPHLTAVELEPGHNAHFYFAFHVIPALEIQEWKYLPFKAPKRKNYKDLDKQAENFISQEEGLLATYKNELGIRFGDWVLFNFTLVHENKTAILDGATEHFWFKLGDEAVDNPLRNLFWGKKMGDVIYTHNKGLEQYLSNKLDAQYLFRVEIIDILPSHYFCLELFKKHFRIKTNKDMNKKLIEVFSYRNDLSQRRTTVESALKALIYKNPFEVSLPVILNEQKNLLAMVQENPDYNVYRVQKDFNHRLRQLAEKQAREKIFIDQLAYKENIGITNSDVKSYLNLASRSRTKEFIYFRHEEPTIEGQEIPIADELLKNTCLREKAINHAIYHLTRQ